MLSRTFTHLPGVGPGKERRIWESGATSWTKFLDQGGAPCLSASFREEACSGIRDSVHALESHDAGYFVDRMPAAAAWRLYPEFKDRTVFLDIETTGLQHDCSDITVISMFDGKEPRALVQGKDLDEFPDILSRYSLIVTYNGKCFDLPFLHAKYRSFSRAYAHVDLRYPLARLGYRGGLKGIEQRTGIRREGALAMVDGFMAVQLWREHKRGSTTALDTLVRYSLEDVVNLRPLMELVYNQNVRELPVQVAPLLSEPLPRIQIPFDEEVIRRLASAREMRF